MFSVVAVSVERKRRMDGEVDRLLEEMARWTYWCKSLVTVCVNVC